jgi:hypothetical protein
MGVKNMYVPHYTYLVGTFIKNIITNAPKEEKYEPCQRTFLKNLKNRQHVNLI